MESFKIFLEGSMAYTYFTIRYKIPPGAKSFEDFDDGFEVAGVTHPLPPVNERQIVDNSQFIHNVRQHIAKVAHVDAWIGGNQFHKRYKNFFVSIGREIARNLHVEENTAEYGNIINNMEFGNFYGFMLPIKENGWMEFVVPMTVHPNSRHSVAFALDSTLDKSAAEFQSKVDKFKERRQWK